jgi:hypothetical protein
MDGKNRRWVWAVVATAGLALTGCGDSNFFKGASGQDSSREAKKEAGVQALNDRNWQEAIDIFRSLYDPAAPDPGVAKYLASAFVGKAGFDTLKLVGDISAAQKVSGADSESIIYDSVTRLFATDADGTISSEALNGEGGKIDLLRQAIACLAPAYAGAPARTAALHETDGSVDDEAFQAGLYAAVHAVLSVVARLRNNDGELLLTLAALDAHAEAVLPTVTVPDLLDGDLALVQAARDVLLAGFSNVDDNDIAAQLDKFLADIGYSDTDTPNRVTTAELRAYLQRLVDGYRSPRQAAVP